MNRLRVLVLTLGIATALWATEVHVDFDHGRSFAQYKTYRLAQAADPHSSHSIFPNQLMRERIARFVEEALANKGLTRTETAPDILVSYRMTVTEEPQYITFSDSIGPGWGWGDWGCCAWGWGWGAGWGSAISTTTTQMIRLGTLAIDLTDPRHNQLVFEGLSTAAISSKPERNTKRLQKGVNEIFEKYPPQK